MIYTGKVRARAHYEDVEIRTPSTRFKLPSVVGLIRYVRLPYEQYRLAVTKTNVLLRDEYTCQYCGRKLSERTGTVDHVVPTSRGGKHNWRNVTAACEDCNVAKGDRTPREVGMKLKRPPFLPTRKVFFIGYARRTDYASWRDYLE